MKSNINVYRILLQSYVLVAMLGLSVMFFSTSMPPVLAQEPNSDCIGLDIVFLIDQSLSMRDNDPNTFRFKAVQTAIDIIGDNALIFCPEASHRIAVVGFGDQFGDAPDTITYILPEIVNPTLEEFDVWKSRKDEIKIYLNEKDEEYLYATNHEAALEEAATILNSWEEVSIADLPRKKAIMLITDGGPCMKESSTQVVKGCTTFENAMRDIVELTNSADFLFRGEDNEESVYIWVIGLSDAGGQDYWALTGDAWKRIALSHGGEAFPLRTEASQDIESLNVEVNSVVADILNRILGSQLKEIGCEKPIWVDPYLNNITVFHLFRRGSLPDHKLEDVKIRLQAIRGGDIIAEVFRGSSVKGDVEIADYSQDGPNERYLLHFPPPGKYVIQVEGANWCDHIDVRFGQNGIVGEVLSPVGSLSFDEMDQAPYHTGIVFRVQLNQLDKNSGKESLQEDDDFPLSWSVIISKQNEKGIPTAVYEYDMKRINEEQAIYESYDPGTGGQGVIQAKDPGIYFWEIIANADNPRVGDPDDPSDEPIEVYRAQGTFEVLPLIRDFDFLVTSPVEGDQYSLLDGIAQKELRVEAGLTRFDEPFSPNLLDLFTTNADGPVFEAQLLPVDGTAISGYEIISLLLSDDGVTFSGAIRGKGSTKKEFDPGCYQIRVKLTENYNLNIFTPINSAKSVTNVCMVLTEQFKWELEKPKDGDIYSLHPKLGWFPPPSPLPMVIKISRIAGGDLKPLDIMDSTEKALFVGELIGPGQGQIHEVYFRYDKETGLLIAQWPPEADSEGLYELTVSTIPDSYRAAWLASENSQPPIKFTRQDDLLSEPWMLMALISTFILAFLLSILIYNLVTRPLGIISFTDPSTGLILHEEIMGRPLRGFLRKYRSSHEGLFSMQLSKIIVQKKPADIETGKRSVEIELFDQDGEFLVAQTLVKEKGFNHFYTYEKDGEERQAMVDIKYE